MAALRFCRELTGIIVRNGCNPQNNILYSPFDSNLKGLYIQEQYVTFYTLLKDSFKGEFENWYYRILGSPGIGKTRFVTFFTYA